MTYGVCRRCGAKGKTHPLINPHIRRTPNALLCETCTKEATVLILGWARGEETI